MGESKLWHHIKYRALARSQQAPSGGADVVLSYGGGGSGVLPVVGDWNGDGTDTIGIYVTASGGFLLRNSNTGGGADIVFSYGAGVSTTLPVIGNWDGISNAGGSGFARKYEYDRWGNRNKLWTNVAWTGSPRQTITIAGGTIPTNRITSVTDNGVLQSIGDKSIGDRRL